MDGSRYDRVDRVMMQFSIYCLDSVWFGHVFRVSMPLSVPWARFLQIGKRKQRSVDLKPGWQQQQGVGLNYAVNSTLPGLSISSVNGCRLKGSVLLLSKCLVIMERSIILPDGNNTGSTISVSISGSRNSSGASAKSSSLCWLATVNSRERRELKLW